MVLTSPEEFYATLRTKILGAKKRVYLSSLYIGKEERELVLSRDEYGVEVGEYSSCGIGKHAKSTGFHLD